MAVYKVQAPDGRIISLEGPDGASHEEAIAQAQQLYQPSPEPAPIIAAPAPIAAAPGVPNAADAFGPPMPEEYGPPQPRAGVGEILTKGAQNAPASTVGAVANIGRAIIEMGDFSNLKNRVLTDPKASLGTALGYAATAIPSKIARTVFDDPAGTLETIDNEARAQAQDNSAHVAGSTFKEILNAVAQSLPQQAPGLVMSYLTKNPEFALGPGMAISGGQEYGDQRAAGRDPYQAAPAAVANAAAERIGEKLPLAEILDKPAKAGVMGAVKKVGRVTASGTVGEGVTQPLQDLTDKLTIRPDMTLGEAAHNEAVAMGAGGLTEGTLATPIAGLEARKASKNPQAPKGNPDLTPPETSAPTASAPGTPAPEPIGAKTSGESQVDKQPTAAAPAARPVEPVTVTMNPFEKPPAAESTPAATPVAKSETPVQPQQQEPVQKIDTSPERVQKTPENGHVGNKVVTPDGSMEINTQDEVVDASTLKPAGEDLQPRDRSKTTSDMQIQKISNELDPARLGESRTTDQGAPIVGPDNVVESGNGRVAAIRQAHAANGPAAARYRAELTRRGHNIEGMKEPILIRRRKTELSPADRVKFTSLSNKPQIAEMSSTEKAKADAGQITDEMLNLHKGGEPDSADNTQFAQSFIGKAVTPNEHGSLIDRAKRLTQEGIKRIKAALVAKAYNDPGLVENIFDNADPEVKAIGNVLRDRAPEFAKLGAATRSGDVPKRFDITQHLMDAVKIIRDAKRDKKSIADVLNGTDQGNLIEEGARDPMVEKLVRAMYRPDLGRMLPQAAIDKILNQYASQASEQKGKDLFGENQVTPEKLIDDAYEKFTAQQDPQTNGQATFLDAGSTAPAENKDTAASRAGRSTNTQKIDPAEVAKTSGRDFIDMSKNRDINVNKQVFEDAGEDPSKAVNYPPARQRKIIIDQILKKFGMKVQMDDKMQIKDQIDHLADMYVGMNNMAATLGLPANAMSLGGTLTLILEGGKKPYLGAYGPANKGINLPNKSNSFAHEWLHALDHYLMEKYGPVGNKNQLLSHAVRAMGIVNPTHPVQSAFSQLLNALFFDKAEIAAKIIELEDKAKNGKTEKVRAEAEATLKQIKAGSYKGIKGRTDYYKNAKDMPNPDYFASPEEMMARALEAYVGYQMDSAGVTTRGISKLNLGYNSNADERLAKTFPKLQDRMHIFAAFDNFFSALAESEILGKDATPALQNDPNFLGVFDPKYWSTPATAGEKAAQNMSWIRRQLAFIKQDIARSKEEREIKKTERAKNQKIQDTLNPKDPGFAGYVSRLGKSFMNSGAVALWNHIWRTERTLAHAIERKNPGSSALAEANNRIFTRPGEGTAVNQTYSQAVSTTINRGSVVLENLLASLKRGVDSKRIRLNEEENNQLRNALLGMSVNMPKGARLTKEAIEGAAAKLRQFADQQWKNMTQAGLEVGYYAKGAWLRRHYLKDAIMADPEGFIKGAAKTYLDQFDETFGSVDDVLKNLDDFKELVAGMLKSDPDGLTFSKKKLGELDKAIEENDKEKIRSIVSGIYDEVRTAYSQLAAHSWLTNLVADRSRGEFESTFPRPGFMKKRGLPPSADVHLKDFMDTNVERILFHYMVAANTTIAQKNTLNPKGKQSMKQLLDQARKEGANGDDVTDLEASINRVIFGPDTGPTAKRVGRFISLMRMGGILMNLNKVVFSAVVEPQVIALKTRDVRNAFLAYSDQLADMLKTGEGKYFQEVAQHLGAIGTDYADMMQQDRFGGGFETGLLTRETMAKFFRYTGNTGITNIQSRIAIRAGYRWMGYLGDKYLNGTESEKSMAKRDFAELGIGGDKVEAFARWLENNNGRPDLNATNNDSSDVFGADFMKAMVRFRDQAIQHPKKEDRPALANHPVGSVLYTGLGFTFSFWDNVVKAEAKRAKAILENEGGAEAAKVIAHHVATVGLMVATTTLVMALRMSIFDHDKWEEGLKDDPHGLLTILFGRALDNTNLMGPAYSVLFNMYRGSEYGKDPATSLSGMVLSNYLNWLQKGLDLFGKNNSDKNTNTEREFAKQTYRVMAAPAITAALLNAPGPAKLLAVPVGVASMFINSNTAADKVADTVVGPKVKGTKNASTSEPKEPKSQKEPRAKGD